jgi:uncharacterized protein YprB with RNaseH-like and TPR domain
VLGRSFLFLPGIGPTRESRLWRRGVDSWSAYRALPRVPGIRPHLKAKHDHLLEVAEAGHRDPGFVARLLPAAEHWRAWRAFGHEAAFLDIETTGDRTNAVTVVGVRYRGQSRAFVRGKDYTPENVTSFLDGAKLLVTFNGATFDLPVLASEGVRFPAAPHVDLRVVFSRLGYAGGLKKIEEQLGLARHDAVRGLSGYDAVKLWRKWESRGDEEALRTLVAYNVADFENLEPLAAFACDKLEAQLLTGSMVQTTLEALAPAAPARP